ncbi:unnamed protein product [Penicillium nalgiovense]|nr:unnamed protein product [Penicillium nalgiovense]
MFTCNPCNRRYDDQASLDFHLLFSPCHAHKCGSCSKYFTSEADLIAHAAEAHHHAFECKPCGQVLNSRDLLRVHRESNLHERMTNSPVNAFFRSWPNFPFHVQLPPHKSWEQLHMFYGWDDQAPEYRAAWIRYQDALASEVTIWFGDVLDLESWQKLCRAVGIDPLPGTCADGYMAIRNLYVNLIDLIQWARTGRVDGEVKRWKNNADLFEYSIATRRIFERDMTANDKPNVVLRHLTNCMLPR